MEEVLYKEAGMRIRILREKKGYSREQLAELCNISTKFLYEIENGKKGFSVQTLATLARYLETNCDYIVSGDNTLHVDKRFHRIADYVGKEKMKYVEDILCIVYEMVRE